MKNRILQNSHWVYGFAMGIFLSLTIISTVWSFDQNIRVRYELNPNQSIQITYDQLRTQDVEVVCRAGNSVPPPSSNLRGEELFQRALRNELGRCVVQVGTETQLCEYYLYRQLANGKTAPYDKGSGCLTAQHAQRYNIRCNSRVEKVNAICILETLMGEGACLY